MKTVLWFLSHIFLWLLISTLWLLLLLNKESKEQLLKNIEILYQPLRRLGWQEISLSSLWRRIIR